MSTPGTKTWKDFPDFYNNIFIKRIASTEKWTVSDKDKRPIDMHAFINNGKVWGLAFDRGYNPMVDLQTLCDTIPNAANNAFYLDALTDKFVVVDIEPKCPENLKQEFLNLPYLYGEVSMSGKGYHLVFDLPEDILDLYPNAKQKLALKDQNGYYEILINHMVTFTRNMIAPSTGETDISAFRNVFELLAMQATKSTVDTAEMVRITDIDTNDIPYYNTIMATLRAQNYKSTIDSFNGDRSRYEYGMTGYYFRRLQRLLQNGKYKDHEYTEKEQAIIIYKLTSEKLEYRPKHDEMRNKMPWLLYLAAHMLSENISFDSKGVQT